MLYKCLNIYNGNHDDLLQKVETSDALLMLMTQQPESCFTAWPPKVVLPNGL